MKFWVKFDFQPFFRASLKFGFVCWPRKPQKLLRCTCYLWRNRRFEWAHWFEFNASTSEKQLQVEGEECPVIGMNLSQNKSALSPCITLLMESLHIWRPSGCSKPWNCIQTIRLCFTVHHQTPKCFYLSLCCKKTIKNHRSDPWQQHSRVTN